LIKIIKRTFKLVAKLATFFTVLLIIFKIPTKLFANLYPAKI